MSNENLESAQRRNEEDFMEDVWMVSWDSGVIFT